MNRLITDSEKVHAKAYFQLIKLSSKIETVVKDAIKVLGITHSQLNVLSILFKHQSSHLSLSDIKKNLNVISPDVSRLVDRLVLKGFVSRTTCPNNRRKVDLIITKKGIRTFEEGHHLAKDAVCNFFQTEINNQEAKKLYTILNKMYAAFVD